MAAGDRGAPAGGGAAALLAVAAFAAEIAMLAGLAWAGWVLGPTLAVSLVLAVVLPVSASVVWGLWCAPRAVRRLPPRRRRVVKGVLFAVTVGLLAGVVASPSAVILAVVTLALFLVSLPADRDEPGAGPV